MFICTKETMTQLDDRDEGRVAPFFIGNIRRWACIGAVVGLSNRLVDDVPMTIEGGTTTTVAITATATTVTVANSALFSGSLTRVSIEGELVDVIDVNHATNELTIQRGRGGTTAASHGSGATVSAWTLTEIPVSNIEQLSRFPSSAKLQIGNERFTYTSLDLVNGKFLGITRKVDQTAMGAHSVGSTVYQVLDSIVYIVCENPGDHKTKAILQVYVNGRKKAASEAPIHTINMDNQSLVPGHSFVTITFDMTSLVPRVILPPSEPIKYQTVVVGASTGGGSPYVPGAQEQSVYGGSYATLGGGSIGFAGAARIWTRQIPIPSSTPPPSPIREFSSPILGAIEVDAQGLQDTTSGFISGVASQWLRRPMWVVRLLMREAWNEKTESQYQLSTFTSTHTKQVERDYNWDFVFDGMSFTGFQQQAALEGRADLFQESGLWHYVWRQRPSPTMGVDARLSITDPKFRWTPRAELATVLDVAYDVGESERHFAVKSTRGKDRYGVPARRGLRLPWVQAEAMARDLAGYWLSQWDLPRLIVEVAVPWPAYKVELGDLVTIDTPVLDQYGKTQVAFIVRTKDYDLDNRLIILRGEEADAASVSLSGRFRVLSEHQISRSGRFVVQVSLSSTPNSFQTLFPGGVGANIVNF